MNMDGITHIHTPFTSRPACSFFRPFFFPPRRFGGTSL